MSQENATSVLLPKSEDKPHLEDIMDSCRLCMERHKNMIDMFTGKNSKIIEKVLFCTGLQLTKEEWLPSHICIKCIDNLAIAYTFKTTCLTSDERYRNIALKNVDFIKIETQDADFDDDNHFDDIDDENDCKDILKEVLKLSDIKISKLKKESNSLDQTLPQKKQLKLKKTKLTSCTKKAKPPNLTCDICNTNFTSKGQFTEHNKTVHNEKESFICEVCGKVMLHRASLYTHVQSHLPPRHACDSCDYKTWHKHDLTKHKRIHSGVKMFQCEFCTASYHTSSNLRYHIRASHEHAPKRFHCHLCERSFFCRTKLKRHIDSHNDIKRYECDVCHSCFTRRCYWKKHLLRQHGVIIPPQRPGRQKTNLLIGELNAHPTPGVPAVDASAIVVTGNRPSNVLNNNSIRPPTNILDTNGNRPQMP